MTAGDRARERAELRVAALYDIHGNLPALRAVLRELEAERPDVVLVGGDIAWGPMPAETLAALRTLRPTVLYVRGNADREVAEGRAEGHGREVAEITEWCAAQLSSEERLFLAGLPSEQVLEVAGIGETLFCHASPRSDDEAITRATPDAQVAHIMRGVPQKIVVCGHTHAHFDRRVDGRRVVNAGSVGLPFGDRGAHWAWLGLEVTLRVTTYDVEGAAEEIRRSGCPGAEEFASHVLSPPPVEASLSVSPRASGAGSSESSATSRGG